MATLHLKTKTFGMAVCEAYGIDPSLACRDMKINCDADKFVTIDLSLVVTGEKLIEIGKLLDEVVTN